MPGAVQHRRVRGGPDARHRSAGDRGRRDGLDLDYTTASWSEKDGLPSSYVTGLAQDANGYLWVGTAAGLVRFDGYRFTDWTTAAATEAAESGHSRPVRRAGRQLVDLFFRLIERRTTARRQADLVRAGRRIARWLGAGRVRGPRRDDLGGRTWRAVAVSRREVDQVRRQAGLSRTDRRGSVRRSRRRAVGRYLGGRVPPPSLERPIRAVRSRITHARRATSSKATTRSSGRRMRCAVSVT